MGEINESGMDGICKHNVPGERLLSRLVRLFVWSVGVCLPIYVVWFDMPCGSCRFC